MDWHYALAAAGLALVLFALTDQLRTTLSVGTGPGPLAGVISRNVWSVTMRLGLARHPLFRRFGGAGVLSIVLSLATWYGIVWIGWTLVFLSQPDALVGTTAAKPPASVAETFYFTGYSMGTLGNGDFSPVGTAYQLATVGTTITGMALITLGITYLSPVISAVVDKRSFATEVNGLGDDPAQIAAALHGRHGWSGARVILAGQLSQLSKLTQQHRAYPVLHAFNAREASASSARAVANLLDAALIMRHAASPDERLPTGVYRLLLASVDDFSSVSPTPAAGVPDDVPQRPDLSVLRADGMPAAEEDLWSAMNEEPVASLRRRMLAQLRNDGREWPAASR